MSEDLPLATVFSILIICLTVLMCKACDKEHIERMKCIELTKSKFCNEKVIIEE